MSARLPRDLHPVAWWSWAIGLAVAASLTTNPYLLSVALVVGVLLWFYLFNQILLFSAAIGAIVHADRRGGRVHPDGETVAITVVPMASLPGRR